MSIEIELKALAPNLTQVRKDIESKYPSYISKVESAQLNHYFEHNITSLYNLLLDITTSSTWEEVELPEELFNEANKSTKNIEVRTRWDDKKGILLIFKYSIIDDNSANGKVRKELEYPISSTTLLEELDDWILNNGLTYKSKWSRERVEYKYNGSLYPSIWSKNEGEYPYPNFSITTDLNAGYGGLVEVEFITDNTSTTFHKLLLALAEDILENLGLYELDEDILKSMFSFYNKHWEEYYGTSNSIFNDIRFEHFGFLSTHDNK